MNPIIIIPARMASTRLPGKPLADIAGQPMIRRVWACAMAAGLGKVAVAAAEPEILAAIRDAGGQGVMTDPGLPSGSDRVYAALQALDPDGVHDVVINLQGDLPDLEPAAIQMVAAALADTGADIATLAAPITRDEERGDPAVVKAVVAWDKDEKTGKALYFTRATAPTGPGPLFHHIGIYAWHRAALARFVALPPSPLEIREKLEQLRALEAHMTIAVARVDRVPLSVDTPADLARANALIQS
jgi:3-deoxy-manno-octulosonate cytidylyltransferase (CMP-KDO synthetase)